MVQMMQFLHMQGDPFHFLSNVLNSEIFSTSLVLIPLLIEYHNLAWNGHVLVAIYHAFRTVSITSNCKSLMGGSKCQQIEMILVRLTRELQVTSRIVHTFANHQLTCFTFQSANVMEITFKSEANMQAIHV